MTRSIAKPQQVFLDHIKKLITNLLIDNKNYTNGFYYKTEKADAIGEVIKDTQEKGKYILQQIDETKHLIEE